MLKYLRKVMYTSLPYARLIFCTQATFPLAKFSAKPQAFSRHEKASHNCPDYGQTLANRTKPGPSLQVQKRLCLCCILIFLLIQTAQLKVENSAQTTFRFSPVRYCVPRLDYLKQCHMKQNDANWQGKNKQTSL